MNTTTAAPAAGTPVMVTIDPRRAARPGLVVGTGKKAGTVRITYTVKGGAERDVEVGPDRFEVTPAEETTQAPAPAAEVAEDAPAVEVQGDHTRAECEDLDACTVEHLADAPAAKKARKARAPKKAALPEGYVTVTELARAIQAAGLHDGGRTGGELRPSVVNRRIQDARGTEHAFPGTEEHGRLAVKLQEGLDWWAAKNARVAARKAAAAERKAAKAG